MSNTIQNFFRANDSFLETQFSYALGEADAKAVESSHLDFISHTKSISFVDHEFEQARLKWLAILQGMNVNLGFTELRTIIASIGQNDGDGVAKLENARNGIDATRFLPTLERFANTSFDARGLGLTVPPERWLIDNDVALSVDLKPDEFKKKIFAHACYSALTHQWIFRKSKSGGFFMMSLHTRPVHFIGHGPIDTLFGLSTLAHELGHSTTPSHVSLESLFLEFPTSLNDDVLVSNEDDSYRYERIFMEHANALAPRPLNGNEHNYSEKLAMRKAIQNNLHVLKNRMNFCFFSGMALAEISNQFQTLIKEIYPEYSPLAPSDWLRYSTLDQPLSRLGYLKAYQTVFLPS